MSVVPLSLYLDLREGEVADLDTAANAALAFAEAIREAAYILDPSLEIRVGLASGTPGSLSLDAVIRIAKSFQAKHPAVAGLVIVVSSWFGVEVASYTVGEILDALRGVEAPAELRLSDEELEALAAKVAEAVEKKVAKPQAEKVYRALKQDNAVQGVGVTQTPGVKPRVIVPRAEFERRSGREPVDVEVTKRTAAKVERVVLISPVLLSGTRHWRFRSATGEFGAPVKDQAFLDDVLTGRSVIPLVEGVELDVELEIKEELREGVWTITDRTVLKVVNRHPMPKQDDLPLSGPKDP